MGKVGFWFCLSVYFAGQSFPFFSVPLVEYRRRYFRVHCLCLQVSAKDLQQLHPRVPDQWVHKLQKTEKKQTLMFNYPPWRQSSVHWISRLWREFATLHNSPTPAISNPTFPQPYWVLCLQVHLVLSASPLSTTPSGSLKVYSIPRLLHPVLQFVQVLHPNVTQPVVWLAGSLGHTTCCVQFRTPMDSLAAHCLQ